MNARVFSVRRCAPVALLALVFVTPPLCPASAFAYVRVKTSTGNPFAWPGSCVAFAAYPYHLSGLTVEQFGGAATAAAQAWSRQDATLAACTYLDLQVTAAAATDAPPTAKYDRLNNILFVTDTWAGDAAALAVTSVVSLKSGEMVDTDIEVNAVDFRWADLVAAANNADRSAQDLQNALTHEMGHAIGLGHTCYLNSGQAPPTDQNGDPIPDCSGASQAVRDTTMFPSAEPRDISKRTLAPDDQQAVCDIYPLAADPRTCAWVVDAGIAQIDAGETVLDAGGPGDGGSNDREANTDPGGCSCTTGGADESSGLIPRAPGGLPCWCLLLAVLSSRPSRRRHGGRSDGDQPR